MLVAKNSGNDLTVENCSVSGTVTTDAMYAGGLVGMLRLDDEKTARIENVTVNVSVSNTKDSLSGSHQSAAGIVGTFFPHGAPQLVIKNANVSGSANGGNGSAGGVLGAIAVMSDTTLEYYNVVDGEDGTWYTEDDPSTSANEAPIQVDETPYAGGSITISNCLSTMSVTGTLNDNKTPIGSGGILGSAGQHMYVSGDNMYYYGTLTIDNCVVEGSVARTLQSSGASGYNCGGVIGLVAFSDATINVEHCLIKASFPQNDLTRTDGTAAGIVVLRWEEIRSSSITAVAVARTGT